MNAASATTGGAAGVITAGVRARATGAGTETEEGTTRTAGGAEAARGAETGNAAATGNGATRLTVSGTDTGATRETTPARRGGTKSEAS